MSKDMKLTLRISADGTAMIQSVKKADTALVGLGNSATDATKKIGKTRRGVESISKQLARTKNQLLGFFAFGQIKQYAAQFINTADTIKLTNARLLQATGSQTAFNVAQNHAKRIAKESRSDYLSTLNLLSRITTAAQQYGVSQEKIGATTSAVTYGLKLYGASAVEVSSVQTQLSQALASGTLAGDEFKSMAEASPRLMQALADGMGVARGELKKMAADGKLTTEIVINALAGQAEVLEQEFSQMPITVSDAWGQLKNVVIQTIGNFDAASGISTGFANILLLLRDNIAHVVSSLKLFFHLMLAWSAYRYLPKLLTQIATATGAWANAQIGLNAAQSSVTLSRFIGNINIAKGSIRDTAKALFSIKGAVGVAAAAFVGWKIGTWARENFTAVRVVAYSVVVQIIDYFDGFKTWMKQVFNHVKSFGIMAMNAIVKAMHWLVTKGKNIGLRIENIFKSMYLGLLRLTKLTIEKIGGAWKGLTASISGMMATALGKVKNSLSGLTGFEAFGKKFDLIPQNILNGLDTKIDELKERAKDTTYVFNTFDEKIKDITASIKANEAAIVSNNKAHENFVGIADNDTQESADTTISKNTVLDQLRSARHTYNMADIDSNTDYEIEKSISATASNNIQNLGKQVKAVKNTIDKIGGAAQGAGNKAKKALDNLQTKHDDAVSAFANKHNQSLANYAFETSLIGKQADEVERLRYEYELMSQAEQAKQGLSVAHQAQINVTTESIKKERQELVALRHAQQETHDNDWIGGMQAGIQALGESSGTVFETMKNATTGAFGSMADGIANFVATGKGNFRSLTASILADMSKMLVKAAMMRMFGSLFGGLFGNGGAFGSSGTINIGMAAYANGGAFANGIQYYANGDVFNKPTAFRHAGGLGVMGEAGPEAIMPLTRGSDGKLGVQVHGQRGGSQSTGMINHINIAVNVNDGNVSGDAQSQQAQGRELAENLDGAVRAVLAREIRPGGMLNNGR